MRPESSLFFFVLSAALLSGCEGGAVADRALGSGGEGGSEDSGRMLLDQSTPRPDLTMGDAVPFLDRLPIAPDLPVRDGGGEMGGHLTDGGSRDLGPDLFVECRNPEDCDDGVFCNGFERCELSRCRPAAEPPCADDIACTSNVCNAELALCEVLPDDSLCAAGQTCDAKVGCFLRIGCSIDLDCTDASPCNGLERCIDAECQPGEPIRCDDAVACTVDRCDDEAGDCRAVPDHSRCLPGELCRLRNDCEPRPPCQHDDDCDDAIYCNGAELCDVEDGLCGGGAAPMTDDGVECTLDVCNEFLGQVTHTPRPARCNDGQFCNGFELCHPIDGCRAGEAQNVSDAVACTLDACDEAADFVTHTPDDGPCDDGSFCNGVERCDAVGGCGAGEPLAINDGVGCTIDACSEVSRSVVNRPDDSRCDDGVYCNGDELCDVLGGCRAGSARTLDDGFDCTDDACNEGRGEVVHSPVSARCDDGERCNGAEVCLVGQGCVLGGAANLDDGIACTVDTCDDQTGQVRHVPDHERCDDDLYCTGVEVCDPGVGCVNGPVVRVDDGLACTDDACDEVTDRVTHVGVDARCVDLLFCNGVETCNVAIGCQAGAPPVSDDALGCTRERCDEATDRIAHDPVDAACADGLFCNGSEVCDAVRGCLAGPSPVLADAQACTVDTCDEANDRVVHVADHARCADPLFCNGVEQCDVAQGCVAGAAPVVPDAVNCTVDVCNEVADRVDHNPDNARCADMNVCDGSELCDAVAGCREGVALPDGAVCVNNPRAICLSAVCGQSRCGDRYVDGGRMEQCDDGNVINGDGCNSTCQTEGVVVPPYYTGRFNALPDVNYACGFGGGLDIVTVNIAEFVFSVSMAPAELRIGGAPVAMVQAPPPVDGNFVAVGVIPGMGELGCTETYTLAGSFSDANNFCGTFTIGFNGGGCGFTDCVSQAPIAVCGARL